MNIFVRDILNVFWGFGEFTMLKNRLIYKAVALLRITQYSSVWGILAQRIPVCVATEGQLQAVLFSSVENWPQELLGHCDFENLLRDITLSIFKKHVRKRVTCRYCNSFIFFLLDVMIKKTKQKQKQKQTKKNSIRISYIQSIANISIFRENVFLAWSHKNHNVPLDKCF